MAEETVNIEFSGTYPLMVAGIIAVPRSIWEDKRDNELWGLRTDKYIKERINPLDHDTCGTDESDVDIDNCFEAKPEGDGGV